MKNIETELVSSEIGYFLRPAAPRWKTLLLDITCALGIVGVTLLFLWLASNIGAF